jgi:hypothetical protein
LKVTTMVQGPVKSSQGKLRSREEINTSRHKIN